MDDSYRCKAREVGWVLTKGRSTVLPSHLSRFSALALWSLCSSTFAPIIHFRRYLKFLVLAVHQLSSVIQITEWKLDSERYIIWNSCCRPNDQVLSGPHFTCHPNITYTDFAVINIGYVNNNRSRDQGIISKWNFFHRLSYPSPENLHFRSSTRVFLPRIFPFLISKATSNI